MGAGGEDARAFEKVDNILGRSWSPDGRFIAYSDVQKDGSERDIYKLDVETGTVENLTADYGGWDAWPSWSPTGEWIAFTSDRSADGKALDDIWIMKADGSGLRNLTDNGYDWEDSHPAWSPDGRQIAFFRMGSLFSDESTAGWPPGLWLMDADGGNPAVLYEMTDLFGGIGQPSWSPDGRYIAIVLPETGMENSDVWVVSVGGGEAVNVSDQPGSDFGVSWAPDSSALIFTNDNDEADTLEIYIALPDGSDTHLLLEGRNGYADWSPR
ncbi:MAG: DPP IV N-terminal domain-containing protein [Chloroflexota bacterium]